MRNPACELVRAWPLSKGHEIQSLSPDVSIATGEVDGSKSRSLEPLLQSVQVVRTRTCHLRHLVK